MRILRARLDQQNLRTAVRRKAVCENATCRPGAHDEVIELYHVRDVRILERHSHCIMIGDNVKEPSSTRPKPSPSYGDRTGSGSKRTAFVYLNSQSDRKRVGWLAPPPEFGENNTC